MKIEIQWRTGAIECHTVNQTDGGLVVDARESGRGTWAIAVRSSYGGFARHDIAGHECATRREYAIWLSHETLRVDVDGIDFRTALLRSEVADRPLTESERFGRCEARRLEGMPLP